MPVINAELFLNWGTNLVISYTKGDFWKNFILLLAFIGPFHRVPVFLGITFPVDFSSMSVRVNVGRGFWLRLLRNIFYM
ncbi:hypothetical protein [Nitritalea halalkaliphila]|nr:hypothetical protein [Nitritalea halalkaliphila]